MYEIILASQSPRRRQLLDDAGFLFQVHLVKVSENIEENLNSVDFAQALSRRKAKFLVDSFKQLNLFNKLVLSADTIIAIEGHILGKPENFQQAQEFLSLLSGKMHSVITGCTLVPDGDWLQAHTFFEETKVYFRTLTDLEVEKYIQTGEPMDKAGAYAIQGLGKQFVEKYEGSWSNVVGLPLEKLDTQLELKGWHVRKRKS